MQPVRNKFAHIFNQERIARYALAFVLLAVSFLTGFSTANAQKVVASQKSNQQGSATDFGNLPENQRLRIMLRMIKSGQHDQAEQLLQAHPLTGHHAANRTLFLEGLIAKVRKQYDTAVKNFRAALADDPKLTMVRAELAHTLFITKQDSGAKHHLKLLSGAAPSPEAAKQFDQFIDVIDTRRPFQLSIHGSIAPSTNFNNGAIQRAYIDSGGNTAWRDPFFKKEEWYWTYGRYKFQLLT